MAHCRLSLKTELSIPAQFDSRGNMLRVVFPQGQKRSSFTRQKESKFESGSGGIRPAGWGVAYKLHAVQALKINRKSENSY